MEHQVKEVTSYKELGLDIDDEIAKITHHKDSAFIEVEWKDKNEKC